MKINLQRENHFVNFYFSYCSDFNSFCTFWTSTCNNKCENIKWRHNISSLQINFHSKWRLNIVIVGHQWSVCGRVVKRIKYAKQWCGPLRVYSWGLNVQNNRILVKMIWGFGQRNKLQYAALVSLANFLLVASKQLITSEDLQSLWLVVAGSGALGGRWTWVGPSPESRKNQLFNLFSNLGKPSDGFRIFNQKYFH